MSVMCVDVTIKCLIVYVAFKSVIMKCVVVMFISERDRETRIHDYRERDAGGLSDRRNHDYHATYNPREQRDRAYHASRHVDERSKDRSDKRRDHREYEGRT